MSKVVELFGQSVAKPGVDWKTVVTGSNASMQIRNATRFAKRPGHCYWFLHRPLWREPEPVIICPTRLIERRQIFTDCFHLLTRMNLEMSCI